jgi:hypothetical protein
MARSVTFGGQTQFKPGGITRINADGLTPIGLTATGIVQLLGEAEGGAPGSTTVYTIDDPALARSTFRSGPLADAIRVAFGASGDPRIPGGAFRCIAYKTNNSTQSSTQLPGSVALISDTVSSATTTVITVVTGGLVVNAHIGRWLKISGILRRITANTATTITVSPGFPSAPVGATAVDILRSEVVFTSQDYGSHTNQVSCEVEPGTGTGFVVTLGFEDTIERSDEIGGNAFLRIKYAGGPVFDSGVVSAATTSTITLTASLSTALNAWQNMFVRTSTGLQRLIASNTADLAGPFTPTMTLTAGYELTTAEAAALVGTTVQIISVTSATVSITGANGVATGLSSTVAATADNLSITFTTGQTLRNLVDYLNGNTNYAATIPNGVNPDTTLVSSFDWGTRNTTVDVRFDSEITPDTKGSFRRDLQALVNWVNTYSTLATAAKAVVGTTEGAELPAYTGGVAGTARDVPVYFIGGTRGTSSNSAFQSGFDKLIQTRGNHIVPLIAQDLTNEGNGSTATVATVAAQLSAQVQLARGVGKNEMGGYLGFKGTITAIVTQANALNDTDVQIIPQQMSFVDASGTLKLMDEWAAAVAAASMRSGANEVGEPMTFKFVKTTQLKNDTSWSPTSRSDINKLIQNGVMFAEVAPGGIRWVRDITSYIKDDNIAFMDGNTREAVRFVAFDLRQSLEDKFTGVKATPATVASIREFTAAKCQTYREQNIIVDSLDPETETTIVPGFRRLRVFIEGNVATVRVEIFPVTGIVFELNDISLQLPRLAA